MTCEYCVNIFRAIPGTGKVLLDEQQIGIGWQRGLPLRCFICPVCGTDRHKLHRVGGIWTYRRCHQLDYSSRRRHRTIPGLNRLRFLRRRLSGQRDRRMVNGVRTQDLRLDDRLERRYVTYSARGEHVSTSSRLPSASTPNPAHCCRWMGCRPRRRAGPRRRAAPARRSGKVDVASLGRRPLVQVGASKWRMGCPSY